MKYQSILTLVLLVMAVLVIGVHADATGNQTTKINGTQTVSPGVTPIPTMPPIPPMPAIPNLLPEFLPSAPVYYLNNN